MLLSVSVFLTVFFYMQVHTTPLLHLSLPCKVIHLPQVYNEMIRDLLYPSNEVLELFEDSSGEIVVNNLVEVETNSTSEVMRLLQRGNKRRTCEPTAANKTSSRSHAILKVGGNSSKTGRSMHTSHGVTH